MSQPLIAARKVPVRTTKARVDAAPRPDLQVVSPPAVHRLRLPLPVACVLLLTLGLFGLLMTNIAIAGDAYRITDLTVTSQQLSDQQQAAGEELARKSSPEDLAVSAQQLGMVPAQDPTHLTVTGTIGEPSPAATSSQAQAGATR